MKYTLTGLGYYISTPGGASAYRNTNNNEIFFECITSGAVYAPSGRTLCGPGWIFAHQAGQHTVWQCPHDGRYECMTASFKIETNRLSNTLLRAFFIKDEKSVTSFVHEMLYAFHHTNVDRKILADLIWSRLCFWMEVSSQRENHHDIPPRISAVMSYIEKHFSEPMAIDDLADHVSLSTSHLHARFKELVGFTPHQYLIRQRMRSARHLLVTTRLPIKALALEVGYSNAESFCRAFKHTFGNTAAKYRLKYTIYQDT